MITPMTFANSDVNKAKLDSIIMLGGDKLETIGATTTKSL